MKRILICCNILSDFNYRADDEVDIGICGPHIITSMCSQWDGQAGAFDSDFTLITFIWSSNMIKHRTLLNLQKLPNDKSKSHKSQIIYLSAAKSRKLHIMIKLE